MKILVGLGNIGMEYVKTKHNVGFDVINLFAKNHGIKFYNRIPKAFVGEANLKGEKVILVKPKTFMNLSGEAVKIILNRFSAKPEDLLIIYDDLDLEMGSIRVRSNGSAGGHKGMKSIITLCHTPEIPRMRIGIGRDNHPVINQVLSRFHKKHQHLMNETFITATKALDDYIEKDIVYVMNKYNS